MIPLAEILVSVTIVIGAVFTFVGSYGLLKLDNPMSRLHAPTKAGTLGVGSFLAASMLYAFVWGSGSAHELLIMAFLFVTAPVSAMFIAKVAIHRRRLPEEPPAPREDSVWATRDTGPATPRDSDPAA